jgi:hypothetical protein
MNIVAPCILSSRYFEKFCFDMHYLTKDLMVNK